LFLLTFSENSKCRYHENKANRGKVLMLKRYSWQKQMGQSLIEYVVSGTLIGGVCIAGLMIAGNGMNDQLKGLKADLEKNNGSAADIQAMASLKGITTAPDKNGLSTVTIKLSSGAEITLEKYPADLNKSIATSGANGTTEMLLANMDSVLSQLYAAENLTPEQTNFLIALSNQGHKMADILKQAESIAASTGDSKLVNNTVANMGWASWAGYGAESGQFLELYNLAETSGALADPTAKSVVSTLVSQILNISNAAETGSYSFMWSNDFSPITQQDFLDFTAGYLNESGMLETTPSSIDSLLKLDPSMLVHQDSAGICTVGGSTDSGTQCGT
jgi:hypothetical protein